MADLDEVSPELGLAHRAAKLERALRTVKQEARGAATGLGVVSRAVEIGGFDPVDVVAALAPLVGEERAAKIEAVAAARLAGVAVVLEDLRDPHNAGAALRSSEAMGVLGVHIISTRHRFRTSARVTQGCEKWLEVHRHGDAAACAASLRERGVRLLAAVPDAPLTVEEIDPRVPTALAFGNEHTGLSPELRALADGEFRIPMHGFSQSLNVSVSVAVSLHVLSEARRRALGREGDLEGGALMALRARCYARDVRNAAAVVARYVAERRGSP